MTNTMIIVSGIASIGEDNHNKISSKATTTNRIHPHKGIEPEYTYFLIKYIYTFFLSAYSN
jgi:hypothetical protein